MDKLLKLEEVAERVGLGESTVRLKAKDETDPFPAPVRVGKKAVRWRESEVDSYIKNLI